MIRNMIAAAVFLLLFAAVPIASADSATWTFTDLTFSDGATVTGSFVYDATTNTVTSVDITTFTGILSEGATYTSLDPGYGPFAFDMAFVTLPSLSDYTGTPALEFQTLGDVSLTNLGGVIPVDVNEFVCTDGICDTADEIRGALDGGSLVGVVDAPEPSSVLLLAIGLFAVIAVSKPRAFQPKLNNR
jgi:PEP-CTERM motif